MCGHPLGSFPSLHSVVDPFIDTDARSHALNQQLRSRFSESDNVLTYLKIDTVEKMQGEEANVVIILYAFPDPVR